MPRRKQGLPLLSVGLTTQLRHRDPGSIWILPPPLWVSGRQNPIPKVSFQLFVIALSGTRKLARIFVLPLIPMTPHTLGGISCGRCLKSEESPSQ